MKFGESPLRVCDTGHNTGGWQYIARQLERVPGVKHMVIGFVNDKDVTHILEMMPRDARYYFTRASVSRALPAESLQQQAKKVGLQGEAYNSVGDAYRAACADATPADTVFVGGSTFVVADLLSERQ
jgi:dihydrofolate synthase/folylpolyglutamate synthase